MITIHDLTKRFYSGGCPIPIVAVNRLSFRVSAGEVYGLLRPDHGYAEVGGFRTCDAPDEVKSRVGLVSANDGVYPWLSVREMLLFFADLYGVPPRQARDNVRQLADLFGLV